MIGSALRLLAAAAFASTAARSPVPLRTAGGPEAMSV